VEVRQEHMPDLQPESLRIIQILVHIALRVDDSGGMAPRQRSGRRRARDSRDNIVSESSIPPFDGLDSGPHRVANNAPRFTFKQSKTYAVAGVEGLPRSTSCQMREMREDEPSGVVTQLCC
jgi:hypothetical protein